MIALRRTGCGSAVQVRKDADDATVQLLGHSGSKVRNPASTCPMAAQASLLACAPADALLVSPWTRSATGGQSEKVAPSRSISRPI